MIQFSKCVLIFSGVIAFSTHFTFAAERSNIAKRETCKVPGVVLESYGSSGKELQSWNTTSPKFCNALLAMKQGDGDAESQCCSGKAKYNFQSVGACVSGKDAKGNLSSYSLFATSKECK